MLIFWSFVRNVSGLHYIRQSGREYACSEISYLAITMMVFCSASTEMSSLREKAFLHNSKDDRRSHSIRFL
jgi:hypothetical protein